MAKRLSPAIEEKIKLFSEQRPEIIAKRGLRLDRKNVIPQNKTHENNIGDFVLETIRKLGLQQKINSKSGKNVAKAHPNDTEHEERSEKAIKSEKDIIASDTISEADPAIKTPVKTVPPVVVKIENVEQLSIRDRPSILFPMRLQGTKEELKKSPIFKTVAMRTLIQTLLSGTGKAGVRGNACSGKTSVLYGAMQIFGEQCKDWRIILITNKEHLRACYMEHKVLLVIDDILDQNDFMLKHWDIVKHHIDKGQWKVMFSYSNESYTTIKPKALEYSDIDGVHVLNISLSYECTYNEKMEILNTNCNRIGYTLPEETCKQCVESVPTKYFFYYVRRYFKIEERMGECVPVDLFLNPIKEILRDLESLKASNPLGFYILVCCCVHGRDIDISIPFQKEFNEHGLEITEWLLSSHNVDKKRSLKRIKCAGRDIPTEFVERTENHKYRIKFRCVVRGVQLAILKELNITDVSGAGKLFKHALFLCDYSIIRTCLRDETNVASPLQLKIHEVNFRYVAARFIKEIQSGHVQRVGQHPLFSNDEFKRKFYSKVRSKHDDKYIWDIFSKLDKQTEKALIVFAVELDKPDHATNLTNIILKSKKWRKYSRKEGDNVQRHLLVLRQNASALERAVRYTKCKNTLTVLIDSVFCNVSTICKWKSCWKEEALRIVIGVHAKTVSECPESTIMELFQNIKIGSHLGDQKQSLLHLCVICRNDHVLKEALKDRKVEVNRKDVLGRTPLHTAVEENNLEAVRILINHGAVIEIRDHDGNTAIHLAIHKSIHILEELVSKNGTDVNVRNNAGKTPYQLARELNNLEHMRTLETADVNDQ